MNVKINMKQLVIAVLTALSLSANASWITGNDLMKQFNGSEFERGASIGFIVGVASALDGDVLCIPTGVTPGQMRDMVQQALRANPNIRHNQAEYIVAFTLMTEFPCETKPKKGTSS